MSDQPFQVLHGRGEEELVLCPGEAAQAEPGQSEDVLDLTEEPLDLLAFAAGYRVGLALHQCPGVVASSFVDVHGDAALRHLRATSLLKGAAPAVERACPVIETSY